MKRDGWMRTAGRLAVCAAGLFAAAPLAAQTELERLESELQRNPNAEPGYLGIIGNDRDEKGKGVRVIEMVEGGPAAVSGLQKNDLIVAVDQQPLPSLEAMDLLMRGGRVGQRMEFDVLRNGQAQRVLVILGRRPSDKERRLGPFGRIPEVAPGDAAPGGNTTPNAPEALPAPGEGASVGPRAILGVRSLPITDAQFRDLRLPSKLGAIVVQVTPGSPADTAGLQVDDVIVAIDAAVVNRPGDLTAAVIQSGPGKEVQVSYYREGRFVRTRAVLVPPQHLPLAGVGVGARPPAGPLPPEVSPSTTVQRPEALPAVPSAPGAAPGAGGLRWMRPPRAGAPASPDREELPAMPSENDPAAGRIAALEKEVETLRAQVKHLETLLGDRAGRPGAPSAPRVVPPSVPEKPKAPPANSEALPPPSGPSLGTGPEA